MKSIRFLALLLTIPVTLCISIPARAADWKHPSTWIPSRLKPFGNKGEQTWDKILMWDDSLGRERGIRVALMPAIENKQNVPIDRRMTIQMQGYMQQFCEEVITVLDIEDPQLRDRLDDALNACIKQWKRQGHIDPKTVSSLLPKIAVDAVVLFERTIYDQAWRGDRKMFRVGIVGAAFAVDTGDEIFRGDVLEDAPWSGMQNTVSRVERQAIQSFLGRMHDRFAKIAAGINAEHQARIQAALQTKQEQEQKRLAQLQNENEEIRRLAGQASGVLLSATEPANLLDQIRQDRDAIMANLKIPAQEQTETQLKTRRQMASKLRDLLTRQQKYAAEQERLSHLPPADQPVVAPTNLPGSEEPLSGNLLIDFSGILTPTPSPTATPRDYVPPGAFNLPVRARRTPLPPLRPPTPTPSPTPASRAHRIAPGVAPSAPAPLPLSTTVSAPFPATASIRAQTKTISGATLPVIAPPGDKILKDVKALRRRLQPSAGGSSPLQPIPSQPVFDMTPTRQVIH